MRLRDRLAALYPAPPPADPEVRDALERALLNKLPPKQPSRWQRRLLLGGLAGLAVAGACIVPANYSMDFGRRLAFRIDDEHFDPEALSEHIRERFDGIEKMSISVSKSIIEPDEGPAQMQFDVALDVMGDVDSDAIEASLLDHFDALTPTDIDIETIDETVHGTLGGMLSLRTLGVVVDRGSAEDARARILLEFESRGLPPPRRVEVTVDDRERAGKHEREVRVKVEAEHLPANSDESPEAHH